MIGQSCSNIKYFMLVALYIVLKWTKNIFFFKGNVIWDKINKISVWKIQYIINIMINWKLMFTKIRTYFPFNKFNALNNKHDFIMTCTVFEEIITLYICYVCKNFSILSLFFTMGFNTLSIFGSIFLFSSSNQILALLFSIFKLIFFSQF